MLTTSRHLFAVAILTVASCLASLPAKAVDDITIITLIPFDDLVIPVPTPFQPDGVHFYGDFNGDGHDDLLIQGLHQGDPSYIFLNDGTDKYRSINQSITGQYQGQYWTADTSNLYIGDFNADGRDDIIVESVAVGGANSMLYATTSGTFDSIYVTWENMGSGGSYTTVTGTIAGAFEVSDTGAATYSVPLTLPPGTAGMEPSLSLNYSSQGGNGLMGVGWSLGGLSVIHRCPATQVQDGFRGSIKFDSNDRFCLDGQRLIAISGTYGANGTEYRTEIDSFSRIKSYGTAGSGPAYFIVETKAGQKMQYGNTTDSRIEAQGKSSAFIWAVNRIQDTVNNYLTFQYYEDSAIGEYYPTRIDYTGNTTANTMPTRSVVFSYTARPAEDMIIGYISGSKISTTKRLTNIKTYIKSALTTDELVRDYQLSYEQGTSTRRSRVSLVKECADDECYYPTQIIWQDPNNSYYQTLNTSTFTPSGTSNWTPYTGDLNGDGKEDLIFNSGSNWQTALSNGDGTFGNFKYITNFANPQYEMLFEDVDGDGDDDMLRRRAGNFSAYLSNGDGTFAAGINTSGVVDTSNFKTYPADINGDGRQDFIIKQESIASPFTTWSYYLYFLISNGNGSFTRTGFSINTELSGQALSDWKLYATDISGDGKADVLLKNFGNNSAITYLSNGNGTFTKVLNTTALSTNSTAYSYVYPGDLNGDGASDLIFKVPGNNNMLQTMISKGDGTFYQAFYTPAFSTTSVANYSLYPGDINGDGRTDIIFKHPSNNSLQTFISKGDGTFFQATNTSSFSPDGTANWATIPADISGDGKVDLVFKNPSTNQVQTFLAKNPLPDLVSNFKNGLGAEIKPTYKPITDNTVYSRSGNPVQSGERVFQGPMHVVSQTQDSNGINGYNTTSYFYSGAKIHLDGRGFLGFANREVKNVDTGIYANTAYRQDFPFIGLAKTSITNTSDLTTLQSAFTTWNSITTNTNVYFPYIQSSSESNYDLTRSWISSTSTSNVYNTWGDPTSITVTTQDVYGTYTTLTTNTYAAADTTNWILARLTQSTVKNTLPDNTNATRKSTFAYFSGTGLLKTETIEPGTTLEQKTEYTYDTFGNKVSASVTGYNMPSRTTSTTYGHDGAYPISITNPLGHKEYRVHDARFGEVVQLLGPNGLQTKWNYDDLGRNLREDRADGTSTTWSYSDCFGCITNGRYIVTTTASGAGSSSTYYDNLGRVLRTEGTVNSSLVYQDKEYDGLGRVSKESLPYLSGGTKNWTTYTYDVLGRILTATVPDGIVTQYEYNGLQTTAHADKNGKNQINIQWKNALGHLVKVQDNINSLVQYSYDPFGNLLKTIDPAGNEIRMTYDIRGNKKTSRDPDMGSWSYTYNALSELTEQTDAKGQKTRMEYDLLGRLTKRIDAYGASNAETSQWFYDTAPGRGVGKLHYVTGMNSYQRNYTYDNLGRNRDVTTSILSTSYTLTYDYDAYSRVTTVTYPQGISGRFATRNIYDSNGYLKRVENASSGLVYWQVLTTNPQGQITREKFGNGLETSNVYNYLTGRLEGITTGATGGVQSWTFVYDSLGNLEKRKDTSLVYNSTTFEETFTYDTLNRVKTASSNFHGTSKWNYNAIGNITCNTKFGASSACDSPTATNYTYPASGTNSVRPHAVSTAGSTSYSYDANGNMTSGAGRTISYTSYNIPANLTQGSKYSTFQYNPDRARIVQTSTDSGGSTTIYLDPGATGGTLYAKEFKGGVTSHIHYIYGGTGMVGTFTERSNSTQATRYFHKDHLGSIDAITKEDASVAERLSYDAFGERRTAPCSSSFCLLMSNTTHHGFTGHEHIDEVGLIHMNGRVYDPKLGRFLSADPNIQAPTNIQSLNRYSYVLNNPLSMTDPSGYFFKYVMKKFTNFMSKWGTVVASTIAAAFIPGFWGGFIAGFIGSGGTIQAGLVGGVGAFSFGVMHNWKPGGFAVNFSGSLAKSIAHGVVGGVSSMALGGKFKDGFMGSFASQGFEQLGGYTKMGLNKNVSGAPQRLYNATASAVIGGSASVIGGGKFSNGAVSGAFSRLFNDLKYQGTPEEVEKIKNDVSRLKKNSIYGKIIIDAIVSDSETVTIAVTDSGNSYNPATNTIKYNLKKNYIYDGSERWHSRPPEIGLGHEAIHAIHDLDDSLGSTRMMEELNTTMKENIIRYEYNIPVRPRY